VIAPSLLPARVRQLFAKDGLEVVTLPMAELCDKAGGASRCLVCHFPNAPALSIPSEFRLDAFR